VDCLMQTELIKKYGFPVESHNVFTEDDYVLTLHRIPFGNNASVNNGTKKRRVVFLHHGLCSSSVDWIMQPPHKALRKDKTTLNAINCCDL
jgi:lysosomal acid lipase/cholesteryl ester hydrolase